MLDPEQYFITNKETENSRDWKTVYFHIIILHHSLYFHRLHFSLWRWAHFVQILQTQVGKNQRKLKLFVEYFIKKEKTRTLDQKDVYLRARSTSVWKSNYSLISILFGSTKEINMASHFFGGGITYQYYLQYGESFFIRKIKFLARSNSRRHQQTHLMFFRSKVLDITW